MQLTRPSAFGYRPGWSQPSDVVTWSVNVPADIDLRALDDWLIKRAGVPADQLALRHDNTAQPTASSAVALAWRVLLLSQVLQMAAKVSIFDPGRLISATANPAKPGQWSVKAWLARADHLPESFVRIAMQGAQHTVDSIVGASSDATRFEQLISFLDQQIIPKLGKLARHGKSLPPLLAAAHRRNIPFRHLPHGHVQLGWGSHGVVFDRSTTDGDSARGNRFSGDKTACATLLRQAGLPGADHLEVRDEAGALRAARQLGWPLVVKPADRERGEGVQVGIDSEAGIALAFRNAATFSKRVLVERHVQGVCHRVFVAARRMLYVVKRLPIGFYSDGQQTIGQTIESSERSRRERPPWARDNALPMDDQAISVLAEQGYVLDSIPALGRFVALRTIESTEWGGVDEEFTGTIHPDNIAIAEQAASALGLVNAGVDILSTDITRPWHETGAIINEVNFAPLLGGGEISRAWIDTFLDRHLPAIPRVPVLAFLGGPEALRVALHQQRSLCAQGLRCYLTAHDETRLPDGNVMPVAGAPSLFNRVLALTMNRAVDAIVMLVQTDEWLRTGLPIDRLDAVNLHDLDGVRREDGKPMTADRLSALTRMLDLMVHREQSP